MLNAVEKNDNDFMTFCDRDVFGTRIKAYFSCYSTDYDFVKFWKQTDKSGNITAAVSRIDGDVTLCADENSDTDELAEFLQIVGFLSIQCEKKIAKRISSDTSVNGYVVRFKGNDYKKSEIILKEEFELKEIYDIIKAENLVGVGDFLPWLSDTTFRCNRGVTTAFLAEVENKNAGCAMVLFRTDKASLLGAVATVPEFRGMGIAGTLVVSLAQEENKNGRRAELLCKNDSIVDFYKSIGFEAINEWSIITNEAKFL